MESGAVRTLPSACAMGAPIMMSAAAAPAAFDAKLLVLLRDTIRGRMRQRTL